MSEFKELVKSFEKTREYVRDFFVYGFKTRNEFNVKSSRTYDNERRRIESWLKGFVKQDYTSKGKNIYLSIDSNLLDINPLYRVWKTKSFTDNDLMLHFFLLDYLQTTAENTAEELTEGLLTTYGTLFDTQLVRRKCNTYSKEGLLLSHKIGKEIYYKLPTNPKLLLEHSPFFKEALSYYQIAGPLGIIGNTIMDNLQTANTHFRVKHCFFVHTLEDEVLLDILNAIHKQSSIRIKMISSKKRQEHYLSIIPLQIFTSTRTGRRFLCCFKENTKRFQCYRMDAIKQVTLLNIIPEYEHLRHSLHKNLPNIWGVSFQNNSTNHLEWVKMTLHINEPFEHYIVNRLELEGKGGTIEQIDENTYTYYKEVFDINEMLPWLRTFIGRIVNLECSSLLTKQRFYQDLDTMYKMYDI